MILLSLSSTYVAIGQAWYDSTYPWSQNQHDAQHTGASESTPPSTNNTIWTYSTNGADSPTKHVIVDGGRVFGIRGDTFFVLDETTGDYVLSGGSGGEYETNVGGAYAMDKIYYTSHDINGQGIIYCYNATSGSQLWNFSKFGQIRHAPTLSGNRVYVGTVNNYIYCIEDGIVKWNKELEGPILSAPAIDNDLFCIGCNDGKLYAFNISGVQPVSIWNFTIGNSIMKPITIKDDKVYFSGGDGTLYVLNKTNGQPIWSWKSKSDEEIDLAVASGVVYVCTNIVQGGLYALYTNVTAGNYNYNSTEPLLWSDETADGSYGIAIAGNALFYVDLNNILHARNTLTGTNLWSFQLDFGATNPIVADGHVFVADQTRVYCIGSIYPIPEFTLPMTILLCGILTLTAIGLRRKRHIPKER
jgi:outer membrane protein assembly factor BamB